MKIVVGSENPVKLKVVEQVFSNMFPDAGCSFVTHKATSNVSDQPIGTEETKGGAFNRVQDCKRVHGDADYWVGLEGGLVEEDDGFRAVAWMCVENKEGKISYGHTGGFMLPGKISKLILEGEELGFATDKVFGTENSKHKEGTIGILTDGNIDRVAFYTPALIFALIPFLKPDLYGEVS